MRINSRPILILAAALVTTMAVWPTAGLAAVAQPRLLTAGNYTVMAASAITNTGSTVITGNLAIAPNNASSITGFPPGIVTGTKDSANAAATQAQTDLVTTYNDAAGATPFTDLTGQNLGGKNLTPGVYRFNSSAQLTGTMTLDGQGSKNATFIFQIGSTLTTASGSRVLLINGAAGCAVFWQVTSSATLGTTTAFQGNLIALQSITMTTGATIGVGGGANGGRALARNGALTLDSNIITAPPTACSFVPAPTPSPTGLPNASAPPPAAPSGNPWLPIALVGLVAGIVVTSAAWRRRRRA